MTAGIRTLCALVIGVALVTGCSHESTGPLAVPTSVADCGKGIFMAVGDGGVMAGLDWPHGSWPLGTPAQAYICIGGFSGLMVTLLQSGGQVTVQPAEQTVPPSGVLPVSITATASGKTELILQVFGRSERPEISRPVVYVVADHAH